MATGTPVKTMMKQFSVKLVETNLFPVLHLLQQPSSFSGNQLRGKLSCGCQRSLYWSSGAHNLKDGGVVQSKVLQIREGPRRGVPRNYIPIHSKRAQKSMDRRRSPWITTVTKGKKTKDKNKNK